jgi:RNA polymerase sigma-70 factor (ECF subfamily)
MKDTKTQFIKAYDDYADNLFRYCFFKIGSRELAKDMVQEIFTKTWVYMSKGNEITNIKSFLYKTASNMVIDEYRKKHKKTESLDNMYESGFDYAEDTNNIKYEKIDGEKAIEVIKSLPETYRDIIFMRYVQELSMKEISEITGESANTIAVRIYRGLEKAKKIFNHK